MEFVGGSTGDLVRLREGAAEIEDPDDRLAAEVELAANTARIELAAGRDWRPPLAQVRGRLGAEPSDLLWQLAWPSTFRGMLAAAAIGVAAFWVVSAID